MNRARGSLYATERAAKSTDRAVKTSQGGYNRMGRAMLELSRGAEDFAIVYGTAGLGAALRASSNNISQFASIINPTWGAVAGFATAIGTVLVPYLLKSGEAAEKSAKKIDIWAASTQRIKDSIEALKTATSRDIARQDISEMGVSDLRKAGRDAENEIRLARAEVEGNMREAQRLARPFIGDLADLMAVPQNRNESPFEQMASAINGLKVPDETMKRIKELEQSTLTISRENALAGLKLMDIQSEMPAARQRDAMDRRAEEEERRAKQAEADRKADADAEKERQRKVRAYDDLSRSLADELDPDGAAGRGILNQLQERLKTIDFEFGGDEGLKTQAERSAREQARRLGTASTAQQSPAALTRGASATVGMLNRIRNQSVSIPNKQLAEARKTNAKIDQLIEEYKRGDLPASGFN